MAAARSGSCVARPLPAELVEAVVVVEQYEKGIENRPIPRKRTVNVFFIAVGDWVQSRAVEASRLPPCPVLRRLRNRWDR